MIRNANSEMILFKLYCAISLSTSQDTRSFVVPKEKRTFEKTNFVRFALKKKYCKCLNV